MRHRRKLRRKRCFKRTVSGTVFLPINPVSPLKSEIFQHYEKAAATVFSPHDRIPAKQLLRRPAQHGRKRGADSSCLAKAKYMYICGKTP
ncbi:hypothetical protein, partial [Pontibacter harenae]|uniref:hypothetical protein n=1 Tax=Pontibacter harenae TaxID=2894083 RepID=UPI001E58E28C